MTAVPVLFLPFDSTIHIMKIAVIPRIWILGAILLTGYLGGAAAAQVRVGSPLFSRVFFPISVGVLI